MPHENFTHEYFFSVLTFNQLLRSVQYCYFFVSAASVCDKKVGQFGCGSTTTKTFYLQKYKNLKGFVVSHFKSSTKLKTRIVYSI